MKKLLKLLPVALFGFCLVFNSCSNGENHSENRESNQQKNSALSVGQIHNLGLEHVYTNYLTTLNSETEFSLNEFNNSLDVFLANKFLSDYDEEMINLTSSAVSYYSANSSPDLSNITSANLKDEINLLITLVENTITEANDSSGDDLFALSQVLLTNPPADLSSTELIAWEHAVDVMGHSALYWQNNAGLWQAALQNGDATVTKGWWRNLWGSIKDIVVADLAGAVGGGMQGGISCGCWQGAAVGAAAYGLGASAAQAIKQYF
jgi:hypothetical protein